MRNPMLSGSMKIADGRLRHFSLPHGLDLPEGVHAGLSLQEFTDLIERRDL